MAGYNTMSRFDLLAGAIFRTWRSERQPYHHNEGNVFGRSRDNTTTKIRYGGDVVSSLSSRESYGSGRLSGYSTRFVGCLSFNRTG
jgi:hypothetical protein